MSAKTSDYIIAPTGGDYISYVAFVALTWIFFVLCFIALFTRLYIHFACFRQFFFEDYLAMFAMVLHSAEAVIVQLYARYMYVMEEVGRGDLSAIMPDFYANSRKGFIALGASVNIAIVGVLIIKLSFLIFFRRLITNTHKAITIGWWAVFVFTIVGAIAQIGMQQFGCCFGSAEYIFSSHCTDHEVLERNKLNAIFSAAVVAAADFSIIAIPITILWGSRIGMQQKLLLTLVFSLIFFTIAITIVRGSVFHNEYSGNGKIQSGSATWFWFYCEFSVAFLIACIVSFRTLFVQRNKKQAAQIQEKKRLEAARQSAIQKGWRNKIRNFHDNVLNTLRSLEQASDSDAEFVCDVESFPPGLVTIEMDNDGDSTPHKTWVGGKALRRNEVTGMDTKGRQS